MANVLISLSAWRFGYTHRQPAPSESLPPKSTGWPMIASYVSPSQPPPTRRSLARQRLTRGPCAAAAIRRTTTAPGAAAVGAGGGGVGADADVDVDVDAAGAELVAERSGQPRTRDDATNAASARHLFSDSA